MRGLFDSSLATYRRTVGVHPIGLLDPAPRTGVSRDHPGRRLRALLAIVCRCVFFGWVVIAAPIVFAEDFQTAAITAAELMALQSKPDAPLVVDVRPNGEYKSGHVAGAVNIPYDKMEKHLDKLTQAKNGVVLYCTQGYRTRQAEQTLIENDLPNVFHLEGGLPAWRQAGYPIHTGWGP